VSSSKFKPSIIVWQHISPEVIVKGFKKCCTSCAVDGTDDDDLE
jgi:hypothetical protein